ncbi:dual oxidase maturation factor 1-like isoform X2 [Anguilla rostrata]|uniref:dual oxidase maturation factor 1-like isoform X2 n=1 Tax=Anguilla rostrata TaxID=7938 RepID=UPI0030D2EBF0
MIFSTILYPFYHGQRTPFIFGLNLLTVILVFLVFAIIFLLILPGIRGKSRLFWMCRVLVSLFIGAVIVAVNFTSDWAAASMKTNTTYKSFSSGFVNAEIGLHVGLSGINVTLTGNPVTQLNETIDYNEMFEWTDSLDEDYTEALERGLPNPILYIAEKFTTGSPCGFNFQYLYSGKYASATMWTAFCCWLVANILFSMPVILYAGCMMVATAAFIFFSLASFSTIQNLPLCVFAIGTAYFEIEYSSSFWLALATGVLCALIGILVIMLDCLIPEKMKGAFSVGVDDDDDDDEDYTCLAEGYLNSNFLEGVTTTFAGNKMTEDTSEKITLQSYKQKKKHAC